MEELVVYATMYDFEQRTGFRTLIDARKQKGYRSPVSPQFSETESRTTKQPFLCYLRQLATLVIDVFGRVDGLRASLGNDEYIGVLNRSPDKGL